MFQNQSNINLQNLTTEFISNFSTIKEIKYIFYREKVQLFEKILMLDVVYILFVLLQCKKTR